MEGNTVSDITLPWEQDSNTDDVFAWLRPLNEFACHAFHLVVEGMIKNQSTHLHERKFVHVFGKAMTGSGSFSGSDDQGDQEEADESQIFGAFKFSTAVLPREPALGWFIGTGFKKPEVDVVIGPSDPEWNHNQILGKHARLYIHKESCQTTVEALHSMEVTGLTGLKHIGQKASGSTKVLEHRHLVQFGRCTYLFEQGDAIGNGNFHKTLKRFMRLQHGLQWNAHPILSAPSTAAYHTLNEFTYMPGAFGGGTFGEVTVGWAQDGSAVAVKRFKKPNERELDRHVNIIELIGEHANVLKLLHVSSNLEPAFPAVFCVYSPLALASLEDVMKSYRLNIATQIALLIDYLRGLIYLHDSKGIMHRDIKPSNLGVLSFGPFKGTILDLDAATTETLSDDHMQGTINYLAPEIINLKIESTKKLEKYGHSVDVWALGLSAFFTLTGRHVIWNDFDDNLTRGRSLPKTNMTDFVLEGRLVRFHEKIGKIKSDTEGLSKADTEGLLDYLALVKDMTRYNPGDRLSASQALSTAENLAKQSGEAVMSLKISTQGIKRKFGEN